MNTEQWRQAWRLVENASGQPASARHSAIVSGCRDPAVVAKALELLNRCRDSDSRAGTQIDHYLILEELGRGGMGEVYAATDLNLDRSVAVKFLPQDVLQIESAVSRFLTEAKASSALNHPNIVTIHEFVRGENVLAIVMELIDGKTLRDAFTGPAPLRDFLPVARQIALAMAAAHASGILHRDIKPENIMVRRDGIAKVVDFGLAGLVTGRMQDGTAGANRQTTPGGTPAYMSPEQTSVQPLTPASDVYSMGVVFHELLTGCLPGSPGPDGARVHLPPAMQALLRQMLHSSPEARPSAFEVTRALERAQTGSFSKLAIVAAIVATVVTALSFVLVNSFRQPQPNLNARLSAARVVPVTRFAGFEFEPNLSSDGRQVAFAWDGDQGNTDIYVRSLDSTKPLRLTSDPAHDLSPVWSPDGRSIAFVRASPDKREVFIVPASGGPERLVCESRAYNPIWVKDASSMRKSSSRPAWSPDGRYLALTDRSTPDERDSIYLVSVESGEKRKVTSPGKSDVGDYSPAFSPDGRMLAYARVFSDSGLSEIHTQAIGNSSVRRLPTGGGVIRGVTWISADRIVFASNRSGPTLLWSISTRGGNPEPLTTIGKNLSQPSASANGRSLVYVEQFSRANVWRMPIRPGGTAAPLITSSTVNDSAQYSPDGSKIVFVSDRSATQEIWVCKRGRFQPCPAYDFKWVTRGHATVGAGRTADRLRLGQGSGLRDIRHRLDRRHAATARRWAARQHDAELVERRSFHIFRQQGFERHDASLENAG